MSPNIRYLLLITVSITTFVVVGMPIIEWFDSVTDMVQTSSGNQTELR
jgi:hypothetical protein